MITCFSCVQVFVTLWTVAHWVSLSMGFSRQEYWSGLPCPLPGIKPLSFMSPAFAVVFFITSAAWEAHIVLPFIKLILCLMSVFFIDCNVLEGREYGCVATSTYQSQGLSRSSTNSYSINECSLCLKLIKRKWEPTPVFLPGESHGQRSLAGYSPWGHKSQT